MIPYSSLRQSFSGDGVAQEFGAFWREPFEFGPKNACFFHSPWQVQHTFKLALTKLYIKMPNRSNIQIGNELGKPVMF